MAADKFPRWAQLSGVGLELAGAVAGFTLIGYWVDRHYATGPWGLVVGIVLGLVGGLYNLIKQSLRAVHDAAADDEADGKSE